MTAYTVLRREVGKTSWRIVSVVDEASSAARAVRDLVLSGDGTEGYDTFVAVPSRSWQPMKVERVETTRLKVAAEEVPF